VAAASALTLGSAAAAQADSWTHSDPAGDVVSFDPHTDAEAQAPTQERGDVRRVRVAHGAHRVTVRFTMRKPLAGDYGIFYRLRTPRGEYDLVRARFDGSTGVYLTKGADQNRVRCSGIRTAFSTDRRTATASIPRSCLGKPRWVRVGAGTLSFTPDAVFWDDGLHRGNTYDQRLSPRLYRD
jgi:hypothetical protein